jgi:PAS domain S-box-containing protein
MAALLAALRTDPAAQSMLRFLCMIPVSLAAYRKNGLRPGLATAAFYCSAFGGQALISSASPGHAISPVEAISASVFLLLVAYVVAGIAESLWAQSALGGALTGSRGAIARSANLTEVAAYVEQVAASVAAVEASALLLRHPLDGSWRAYRVGSTPLEPPRPGMPATLAWWLVEQSGLQRLNRMEDDPRFIPASDAPVHSLLAHPLREQDGDLAAVLILLNRRGGRFSEEDAAALALRADGAAQALEQAGLYARTDAALTRRAAQVAALQVAARELNADLDLQAIARRAVAGAVEITGADGGLVVLDEEGGVAAHYASGTKADISRARTFLQWSRSLVEPVLLASPESGMPDLVEGAAESLAVPIRREQDRLGLIMLADRRTGIFDLRDLAAVTALADHAAVAVANARLFERVRHEKENTSQIIETMTEGLLTTDAAGTIRAFNPAAGLLTGIAAEAALGQPYESVLGGHTGLLCPVARTLDEGRTVRDARWKLTTAAGRQRVLALSAAPLPGGAAGMVVAMRDITEHEAMEQFQRELSAAFSHGLRTPLANIALAAELLLDGEDGPLEESHRAKLEVIRAQVQRLAEFTQRTLDAQRQDLASHQLEVRPVPVSIEVEAAAARARGAGRRIVRVSRQRASDWVWADETALHTVLDNLLDNALRYSPVGSPVEIRIACQPAGYLTVAVLDRGPGIPEGRREEIFLQFCRRDGADPAADYGHGMGLYISRRLVERMGGRIWVEARPGGGSRFAFMLPLYTGESLAG